ncbi:MAG: sulfite exporter TauE/SafE family protein [Lachnospiraceae bacterium]|nr:sulfite exporter TauE/SafE family protein [Lachnospiraceae bacterium]
MTLTPMTFLIVCPLIFLAGFVDSIAGGGGIVSLPAYLLAGLPMHLAIGTNKFSSSIGTIVSTTRYLKNGCVVKFLILPTVIAALIGSGIGSQLSLRTDEQVLKYILMFVLPMVALLVLFKKELPETTDINISKKKQIVIAVFFAFLIGGYDGYYGPGTGTFMVLALTQFAKLDIKSASGNTKCINLTSNLTALVTFLINGTVLIPLGMAAVVCSVLGNYLGSGLAIHNGSRIIRPVILIVIALLFLKIVTGN